ncbi:MAG: helix-turn-helix domain-containing protein [Methanobacteriaceae archaeon]|jgi:transposase|nr:helix-turn-helix domain-containing protein [Methanobacteriaceae archaeon]
MSRGRNISIEDHLDIDYINDLLSEYKKSYMIYQRLLFIKMLKEGKTVKDASEFLNVNRASGSRWLKLYNEKGFEGLIPNYDNCGRNCYLTNEQKEELKQIISNSDENYTLKRIQKLIKEKFNIEYSEKQVWVIVREKLGFNYGKPFTKHSKKT